MLLFDLDELLSQRARKDATYNELLRRPAMSAGVYQLAAGDEDRQRPHSEDEIYVVLRGRASFTAGGSTAAVRSGSFLYVAAGEPHRFHGIDDDLAVLVAFAPAEGSSPACGNAAAKRRSGRPAAPTKPPRPR